MPNLDLTEEEAVILKVLLKEAGDQFSNHGCNDFHVTKDAELPVEAASRMRKKLLELGVSDDEDLERVSPYLSDWVLFRYFQKRVEQVL